MLDIVNVHQRVLHCLRTHVKCTESHWCHLHALSTELLASVQSDCKQTRASHIDLHHETATADMHANDDSESDSLEPRSILLSLADSH